MRKKTIIYVVSIIGLAALAFGIGFKFKYNSAQNIQANNTNGIISNEATSDSADKNTKKTSELNDKLLRVDNQGAVEVGITFSNPIEDDAKYLVFKTQLNTHSVNLDNYDFSKMVTFKTSDGIELKSGIIWEKSFGEGHHYMGYYKIPKTINGKPVISKNTKYMEIDISNLDNVNNRSFKWENEDIKLMP